MNHHYLNELRYFATGHRTSSSPTLMVGLIIKVNAYRGFPLFRHYRCTNRLFANLSPNEYDPNAWAEVSPPQLYWRPRTSYEKYETNAEFQASLSQPTPNRDTSLVLTANDFISDPHTKCITDSPTKGIHEIYNGETYVATDNTILWSNIGRGLGWGVSIKNPYCYNNLVVWIKLSAEKDAITQDVVLYWWHPSTNGGYGRFYPHHRDAKTEQFINDPAMSPLMEGRILALMMSGMPRPQAMAAIALGALGTNAIPGPGAAGITKRPQGAPGGVGAGSIKANVRVRGNFGYGGRAVREVGEKAAIVQMYSTPSDAGFIRAVHEFDIMPKLTYDNIGSEWTEIPRVGQVPLIDWKNYKLIKVAFQFTVVTRIKDGAYMMSGFDTTAQSESITMDIREQLLNLRRMAVRPFPVMLFGFDDIVTNQLRFPIIPGEKVRGIEFAINDFSIAEIYRAAGGELNRATVNITLQELPLELINLLDMPRLIPVGKNATNVPRNDLTFGETYRLMSNEVLGNVSKVVG